MSEYEQIDAQLYLSLIEQSGGRCEWFYEDQSRCQNTMSLKIHHRTYDRSGRERLEDLRCLCPSHHIIADTLRKLEIGQRPDIVQERMWSILDHKMSRLDHESKKRFANRLSRETERAANNFDAIAEIENKILDAQVISVAGVKMYKCEIEDDSIPALYTYLWKLRIMHLCVEDKGISDLQGFANRVLAELNEYCKNT